MMPDHEIQGTFQLHLIRRALKSILSVILVVLHRRQVKVCTTESTHLYSFDGKELTTFFFFFQINKSYDINYVLFNLYAINVL